MHSPRLALVVTLALAIPGCATVEEQPWYQKTRDVTVKTADTVGTATAGAMKRMEGYLAKKDVLKTFRDSAEDGEDEILAVLHRTKGQKPARPAGKADSPKSTTTNADNQRPATRATSANPTSAAPTSADKTAAATLVTDLGSYRWPLDAGIVSSEYGARWGKVHKGIDIAADAGEPVYAAANGEVIYAGDGLRGYGNVVIIRHDKNVTTLYAHNNVLKVKQGVLIKRGDLIALLGSTGHSTGPHVHFEIRRDDSPLNPRSLLPKNMLAAALLKGDATQRSQYLAQTTAP